MKLGTFITASEIMDRNGKYYTEAEIALNKAIGRLEDDIVRPLINRIFKLMEENNATQKQEKTKT